MPSIAESLDNQSPLSAPLKEGVETISGSQTIVFTQYVKLILPLDGYVFWVRSDLVSSVSLCGCYSYSTPPADGTAPPGPTIIAQGSLHYATQMRQEEDQTIAVNTVVFTSESEIQDLNRVGPCVMYIGEFEGKRFAFNKRGSFYKQAGLYHYSGDAVYPALASQLVDSLDDFDTTNVVVSNSLPIWLTLNQFMPMYPSFLVQENLEPPYASVHIPPESTQALGGAPRWGKTGTHSQLVQEKVKITLYGLRNFSALDFQDYVFQYSLDHPDLFGVMNMPVMRDEKRTQSELTILAQKKVFELEVNYYQHRVREIARQLIVQCIPAPIPDFPSSQTFVSVNTQVITS
jgi:hypothetical protein